MSRFLVSSLSLPILAQGLSVQSLKDEELSLDSSVNEEGWLAGYGTAVRHIGNISVVTVETRASNPMRLPGRIPGGNAMVTNAGAGAPWQFYRTKNGLMLKWIEEKMKKDPDAMAIMIDGGDMILGGCDEAFVWDKYRKIMQASGGPDMTLVMSAETACFPHEMDWHFRDNSTWETRRSAVNSQVENLADDWVLPWTPCRDWKQAPCDPEPKRAYRYPNWGFVMGPVKDLQPLFKFVYNDGGHPKKGKGDTIDQMRAQWYMLWHANKITLDYTGSLVLSMHNMVWGRPDSEAPIELLKDEKGKPWIRNKIINQPCCFAHGNGDGEGIVNRMIIQMNNLTGAA